MSKELNLVCEALNYIGHLVVFVSAIKLCV